jgi:hypothetical protein
VLGARIEDGRRRPQDMSRVIEERERARDQKIDKCEKGSAELKF